MGTHASDEVLATRVLLLNDQHAATNLYNRHSGAATSVAWRILSNPDDIEDVVQLSFQEAFFNLHVWNTKKSFRGWLCGIVRYNALDCRRKKKSDEEHLKSFDYVRRSYLQPDSLPENACDYHSPRWFKPEVRGFIRGYLDRIGRDRFDLIVDPPKEPLPDLVRARQTRDRHQIAESLLIDASGRELSRRITNELLFATYCGHLPGGLI